MTKIYLDYLNSEFIIRSDSKTNPLLNLQLKHHKFEETDNNDIYICKSNDIKNIINLIELLTDEKILFETSQNAKAEINNYNEKIKKSRENSKLLESIKEGYIPDDFISFKEKISDLKRSLLEHQIKSCYHLFKAGNAANFSVPGSGKTSVVLAYFEYLRMKKKIDIIFVIGPRSCFYSWNVEFIQTLGRDPNIKIISDTPERRKKLYTGHLKSELLTCSFQTALNDVSNLIEYFKNKKFY